MEFRSFVDWDVWALAVGVIRYGRRQFGIGFHIGPVIVELIWQR